MSTTTTDGQIAALRAEAYAAGDVAQVALCDAALAGDVEAWIACDRIIREAAARAGDDGPLCSCPSCRDVPRR